VPLFLIAEQSFVVGIDFKDDLKRLDDRFSALSEAEFKAGTTSFAGHPPDTAPLPCVAPRRRRAGERS
jgi:hypothetical protein